MFFFFFFFFFLLLLQCFIEIQVLNKSSVDTDQTPRSAESDLGLHCLWDAKHKQADPVTALNTFLSASISGYIYYILLI